MYNVSQIKINQNIEVFLRMQHLNNPIVRSTTRFVAMLFICFSTQATAFEYLQPLPDSPIIPKNNLQSEKKISLGKQLFFDNRLSSDGTVSCNSCHNLAASGDAEGGALNMKSRGIKRNVPSIWNIGHMSTYYWDARATSLEAQAIDHMLDPRIMDMSNEAKLVERLNSIEGYRLAFKAAFKDKKLSANNIAKALAAFERTLNTPDSQFDKYIKGDKSQLSESAKRGLTLFNDKGCLSCHFGVNFAGPAPGPALKMGDGFYEMFPNYRGTYYEEKYHFVDDLGRYHVTLDPEDKVMWRVPSLRNVIHTAPYFHNGAVNDIHEAVRIMSKAQFNYDISETEVKDVVSFLESLTGIYPNISIPRLPEKNGSSLIE